MKSKTEYATITVRITARKEDIGAFDESLDALVEDCEGTDAPPCVVDRRQRHATAGEIDDFVDFHADEDEDDCELV